MFEGIEISFVKKSTCHDGFTLNDLVSYAHKHNEANGEDNRDGSVENYSANHGAEGESDDPAIEGTRRRQIKIFLLTLVIARGVPMFLAGDEFCRSQRGNNNAYCQDNVTSWVDWSLLQRHDEIFRFACRAIEFRRTHAALTREAFYTDKDIQWFDLEGNRLDWSDSRRKTAACLVRGDDGPDLYLMFNADTASVRFVLPPSARPRSLRLVADTSQISPDDFCDPGEESEVSPTSYFVECRSSVILIAR
jgi:glycogen operon protein